MAKAKISNRVKLILVLALVALVFVGTAADHIDRRITRNDLSRDAYSEIVHSLTDFHRSHAVYTSLQHPQTADEYKRKDQAALSMELSVQALQQEYRLLTDLDKKDLKAWVKSNLSDEDISKILQSFDDEDGIFH